MPKTLTLKRAHLGLSVRDLDASIAFYRRLLEAEPTRVEARYARFETDNPGLLLALNAIGEPPAPAKTEHFGIQVAAPDQVMSQAARLRDGGLAVDLELGVDCCYAIQDKAWVTDPDGRRWEIFAILDDGRHHASSDDAECCVNDAGCTSS